MNANDFNETKRLRLKNHPKPDFDLSSVVTKDEIQFRLFNSQQKDEGIKVTEETIEGSLTENLPLKVLIHGWLGSEEKLWYLALRKEYLRNGDYNIICVNWSKTANLTYSVSCASVGAVGELIASFLVASKVGAEKIHLIGHSLGAHVAGFTGKAYKKLTGEKIGRITALDTAGPAWEHPSLESRQRLHKDDADFVDVHHSDIHVFGYAKPIGDIDFYPNGGCNQPGTTEEQQQRENSNHHRATWYFVESVSKTTGAKEAEFEEINEWTFKIVPKPHGREITFNENISKTQSGVYYFETNDRRPFLKET